MAKYSIENATLTAIAGAIRKKTGDTAAIRADKMAAQIEGIQTMAGQLNIAYGDAEPQGAEALWVKAQRPGRVFLSPLIAYGDVAVEDTGAEYALYYTSSKHYMCGGGCYRGAYYFIDVLASGSPVNYTMSLMCYDPQTNEITTALNAFATARDYSNASTQGRAEIKGNLLYMLHSADDIWILIDLDTLTLTSYRSRKILSTGSTSSSYRVVNVAPAAEGIKIWSSRNTTGADGTQAYLTDAETGAQTSYSAAVVGHTGLMYDDGHYLFSAQSYADYRTQVCAYDYNTKARVEATTPDKIKALFVVGTQKYLGLGDRAVYKWDFDGAAHTFTLVSADVVDWGEGWIDSSYDKPGYAGSPGFYGWYGRGYAVSGNMLYCLSYTHIYSVNTTTSTPILKVTFQNTEYPAGSVIIGTTERQKNRARVVDSEPMTLDVFVNQVFAVGADGNVAPVEAATRSSDGRWQTV